MFNLFNKTKEVATMVAPKKQTTSQIVQQIHKEFYSEVDVLSDWANKQNKVKDVKSDLLEKRERLSKLGFSNTKEIKEADKELERINSIKAKNKEKKSLLEAINYFSQKYPQYKFITEKSVQKICEKYGLVYGELSRYEGTVPDKNLDHMEQFSIDEEDCCYIHKYGHRHMHFGDTIDTKAINFENFIDLQERLHKSKRRDPFMGVRRYDEVNEVYKAPLEIAAPQEDFNMDGYKVEGFKVVKKPVKIPDPVVLQPVLFNNTKYYLIVTAWGDEAEDELVVNEKMN